MRFSGAGVVEAAIIAQPPPMKCVVERHILETLRILPRISTQTPTMRSTRASAAVARLNARDPDHRYSLGMNASGLFYLLRASAGSAPEKISSDLTLDEFVEFANRTGPQKKAKVSKFDVAFEKQLANRNGSNGK
jgi:hypothetical protein